MKKKLFIIINLILILLFPTLVFAFDSNIKDPNPTIDPSLKEMSLDFLGAILWIGYAIAIGMLIYIGVKYMMSSANEKANAKQALINYIIGAIVLAASVTIFTWCYEFFTEAKNGDDAGGGAPGGGVPSAVPSGQPIIGAEES